MTSLYDCVKIAKKLNGQNMGLSLSFPDQNGYYYSYTKGNGRYILYENTAASDKAKAVFTNDGKVFDYIEDKLYNTIEEWTTDRKLDKIRFGTTTAVYLNKTGHNIIYSYGYTIDQLHARLKEIIGSITTADAELISQDTLTHLRKAVTEHGIFIRSKRQELYLREDKEFSLVYASPTSRLSELADMYGGLENIYVLVNGAPKPHTSGFVSLAYIKRLITKDPKPI